MSTPTRITHLIGGTSWAGTAERSSPVVNPATGEQTGVLFAFREMLDEREGDVAALMPAEAGTVLSDALGEVTRGLEVAHGMEGVHFFTRGDAVTPRWLDPSHAGLNLGLPQSD